MTQRNGPFFQLVQYTLCHFFKGCLNFVIVLGINFYKIKSVFFSNFLPFFVTHHPFALEIIFVTHKQNLHIGVTVCLYFFQPSFHMIESLLPGDVVYKQGADCTPIVRSGDGPEVLLTRSVPDLKLDAFVLYVNCLCPKLNSNRDIVGCACLILDELQNHARFAHSGVANYDELEEIVVRIH